MKNIFTIITGLFLLLFASNVNSAVNYGLDHDCATGSLIVTVIADVTYPGGGSGSATWSPYGFTLRWPVALGNSILGTITNTSGTIGAFGFATAGALGNPGDGYYYQKFAGTSVVTFALSSTGVPYAVCSIALTGASGTIGSFEIPDETNTWVIANEGEAFFSNDQGNQVPTDYNAAIDSFVPIGPGIYFDSGAWCGGSGVDEQPGASDGALTCFVNGMGAQLTTSYLTPAVVSDLNIASGSQLTIMPGGALTVSNITTINAPQGLVIASGPTGSGSFIQNATVANTVYNSGGSATVQTYLKNIANVGSFQMHLIGPTVFDPTIADPIGSGPGFVSLGAYDMQTLGTYSYWYRESINNWINIWQPTDSIPRLSGIALSDVSGVSKTILLTGKLSTGSVLDPTQPTKWDPTITTGQGNGTYMFSNPYPSYLSLTQFFLSNNSPTARIANPVMWTWEHENGTWGTWFFDDDTELWDGTGYIGSANGIINPGQGFFAQINITSSQVRAAQTHRVHGHTPFLKSIIPQSLRLAASGNYTYEEAIIKFRNNATTGYDFKKDIEKWSSMYVEATQIYTLASDQTLLTVNSLPLLEAGKMISVPMGFTCGADDVYTITASNIESFDLGTEIWLEDLFLGSEWHSLAENPVYEFTAAPDDPENRFVIHFFSTTGIDDPVSEISAVQIYGYGQDAYIVNKGNETVKEYVAYDMMGRELHRGTLPNSTVNKVSIGDVSAYYVVKVITKEGRIYTDKVFITK